MAKATKKRKRVVLSIEEKVKIVDLLDKSVSYTVFGEQYGIGRSTVGDIKKNRRKILEFSSKMVEMGMSRKATVMKLGDDDKLDQAVYLWFKQKRVEGVPISGPMLSAKALQLSKGLHGETTFTASEEWRWSFVRGTGFASFPFKEKNCPVKRKKLHSLYHPLENCLRRKIFPLTKFSTVTRQG